MTEGTTLDEHVECRLCGEPFRSIGHHVRWAHGITADEYRDRFGIRRSAPLTSPACRAAFSARLTETIAAGKLDEHFAGNADRAQKAGVAGSAHKRAIVAAGGDFSLPSRRMADERVEQVVEAVEQGSKVATGVRRAGISYSGFHGALARRPDLKARLNAARQRPAQRAAPPDPG